MNVITHFLFFKCLPPGVTRHTVSAFCNNTLCLCPSTSTSTSNSGLDSIFTRPTKTVRDRPWASTTITWLPVCNSDRYVVLPPAIPTYACTGPCNEHTKKKFNLPFIFIFLKKRELTVLFQQLLYSSGKENNGRNCTLKLKIVLGFRLKGHRAPWKR